MRVFHVWEKFSGVVSFVTVRVGTAKNRAKVASTCRVKLEYRRRGRWSVELYSEMGLQVLIAVVMNICAQHNVMRKV